MLEFDLKIILIVEDDHDTRVSIREVLEAQGYFVFSATNGLDGLAVLKRIQRPSLILLDQNMPLMSGDEFLTLKGRDPSIADIPVVIISAVLDRSTKLGAISFLKKPLAWNELIRCVEKFCAPESKNSASQRQG